MGEKGGKYRLIHMEIIEKTGFFMAIALMVVLLFLIVFSENGIRDYDQLKVKKAAVSSRIDVAEQENAGLEKLILRLKQDLSYIKHLARHEQGMAEPDELIFKQK
ncbi:MAG: septum formation initiator family protein [Desulfotignum sp.]|jgi:cell division protein FtsB|nr:septum formation initiator family protein [Desulfotignum sp.]